MKRNILCATLLGAIITLAMLLGIAESESLTALLGSKVAAFALAYAAYKLYNLFNRRGMLRGTIFHNL